jgi:hypothetical protein
LLELASVCPLVINYRRALPTIEGHYRKIDWTSRVPQALLSMRLKAAEAGRIG